MIIESNFTIIAILFENFISNLSVQIHVKTLHPYTILESTFISHFQIYTLLQFHFVQAIASYLQKHILTIMLISVKMLKFQLLLHCINVFVKQNHLGLIRLNKY